MREGVPFLAIYAPTSYNRAMNIPIPNSTWVDIIIVIFLICYVLLRIKKGFIDSSLDLIGFLLSMLMATKFYGVAAGLILHLVTFSPGIANAIGFFVIATLTEVVFSLTVSFFHRFIPENVHSSRLNIGLGVIPSFFSGLILILFFLIAIVALPVRPNIKQQVLQSRIGNTLTHYTFGIETNVDEVFGGAVKEALKFLTVKPESNESVDLQFTTNQFSPDPESEDKMLRLINIERTARGLKTLNQDTPQQRVARAHCSDMFVRGYFSHYTPDGLSPFDRMKNAGIVYATAGENLAFAPTVETAHEGLMNSPGHRANILSEDFNRVGIGVIDAGVYGRMFCQEFRD